MTPTLGLAGRVLFLCADPARVEAQLAGVDLSPDAAGPLRDDVSTDEITPTSTVIYYDERLGRFVYCGLRCGGRRPVPVDAVRHGGFAVTAPGRCSSTAGSSGTAGTTRAGRRRRHRAGRGPRPAGRRRSRRRSSPATSGPRRLAGEPAHRGRERPRG